MLLSHVAVRRRERSIEHDRPQIIQRIDHVRFENPVCDESPRRRAHSEVHSKDDLSNFAKPSREVSIFAIKRYGSVKSPDGVESALLDDEMGTVNHVSD